MCEPRQLDESVFAHCNVLAPCCVPPAENGRRARRGGRAEWAFGATRLPTVLRKEDNTMLRNRRAGQSAGNVAARADRAVHPLRVLVMLVPAGRQICRARGSSSAGCALAGARADGPCNSGRERCAKSVRVPMPLHGRGTSGTHCRPRDAHPVLMCSPLPNISCDLDAGWFWRESLEDGLYQIGGALIRASGGSRARYIGNQINFELRWALDLHTTIAVNLAGFLDRRFPEGHRPRGRRRILQRRHYVPILVG
jgi:Alginate export